MTSYARIILTDKTRPFYLQVTSENERFLCGIEVDKEGEEIRRPGVYDQRQRIIDKSAIAKRTHMTMNLHYGTLEPER